MKTTTKVMGCGVPAVNGTLTRELTRILLADAASDVEVVRREFGLSEEMVERLQRALDRLDCAQAILDAEERSRLGTSAGEACEHVSEAVRVLAGNWPQDYPEGAVEWLLVGDGGHVG